MARLADGTGAVAVGREACVAASTKRANQIRRTFAGHVAVRGGARCVAVGLDASVTGVGRGLAVVTLHSVSAAVRGVAAADATRRVYGHLFVVGRSRCV